MWIICGKFVDKEASYPHLDIKRTIFEIMFCVVRLKKL